MRFSETCADRRDPDDPGHVNQSFPYDPSRHQRDTVAAAGRCSQHGQDACSEEPVISFQDRRQRWQSGCERALAELVFRGEIVPPVAYSQR